MGRAERFNYTSDEEKQSLINKAKKGVAAVALAATGLFASACSDGEGAVERTIGGVLPVDNNSEQFLTSEECKEVDNILSMGTISYQEGSDHTAKFPDYDTLANSLALPDGIAQLSSGGQGFLLDPHALPDRSKEQIMNGHIAYAEEQSAENPNRDVQTATVFLFGEPDPKIVAEYKKGDGWPESHTDGIIDSEDLNICVTEPRPSLEPEQWFTGK